ncbi:MAG TPA: hypothetical protein VEI74_10425 [Candidatus Methylomirabilis sp.]|nr:hypothetical protein [Candidatus Methylomirabilis sp.]
MSALSQSDISEICDPARIEIADSKLGIGRELSYRDSPARTVVVYFVESDFPDKVKELLAAIPQLETKWILFNRRGELRSKEFTKNEIPSILEFLIESYPTVEREGDDIYLLAKSGKLFISFDHHLFENGMAVNLAEIPLTGTLLTRLNERGAEIELFGKNG